MKIVHIAPYYHPSVGGGELHLKAISERLVKKGHQVVVFTQRRTFLSPEVDRTLRKSEVINGVLVRRFAPFVLLSKLVDRLAKLRGGYRVLRMLLGGVRLANFPGSFLPGAMIATLRARPDLIL